MSIQARISHSAIDAAIELLAVPSTLPIDTTLSERIRSARLALRAANDSGDIFAAACAVEQLQDAIGDIEIEAAA